MNQTLRELAQILNCRALGDLEHCIGDVASLARAKPGDLSFYADLRYREDLLKSRAGAILTRAVPEERPTGNWLISPDPSATFQRAIEHFRSPIESGFAGIHPTAVVHTTARLGSGVQLGPHCSIDRDVTIGERTELKSGVSVGAECRIGADCLIHANVALREGCRLGNRVVVQPGAVLGACGFGFATTSRGHQKELQCGGVVVEDDVEIGANAAIDRGRFENTLIGKGTKIDNLVQIAHSVQIGPHNLLCAQVGLAGSCATGDFVTLAGQSAVTGHVRLGNRVILAARAGASKNLPKSGAYAGLPAIEIERWRRQVIDLRSLSKWIDEIKVLQRDLFALRAHLKNTQCDSH